MKMERVGQRMVGAQSEQDEREASKVHGVESEDGLNPKIDSRERLPFPQRQKTNIRVCVFTALLLIYIDIY